MNQVRRSICHPHLRFPGDLAEMAAHDATAREGRDVNHPGCRLRKQPGEFRMTFGINGAMASYRLDENEPISFWVI